MAERHPTDNVPPGVDNSSGASASGAAPGAAPSPVAAPFDLSSVAAASGTAPSATAGAGSGTAGGEQMDEDEINLDLGLSIGPSSVKASNIRLRETHVIPDFEQPPNRRRIDTEQASSSRPRRVDEGTDNFVNAEGHQECHHASGSGSRRGHDDINNHVNVETPLQGHRDETPQASGSRPRRVDEGTDNFVNGEGHQECHHASGSGTRRGHNDINNPVDDETPHQGHRDRIPQGSGYRPRRNDGVGDFADDVRTSHQEQGDGTAQSTRPTHDEVGDDREDQHWNVAPCQHPLGHPIGGGDEPRDVIAVSVDQFRDTARIRRLVIREIVGLFSLAWTEDDLQQEPLIRPYKNELYVFQPIKAWKQWSYDQCLWKNESRTRLEEGSLSIEEYSGCSTVHGQLISGASSLTKIVMHKMGKNKYAIQYFSPDWIGITRETGETSTQVPNSEDVLAQMHGRLLAIADEKPPSPAP